MAEKRKYDEVEQSDVDPVVSLQDIIEEDTELESTANAVLGGSDDQECTYNEGYMKRQALYACATCKTTGNAGVCLACSLDCHDGHELYELYTKRNFRCDCGNDKFPDLTCNFYPDKDPTNDKNLYNHNFEGVYCTCKRPYPDPDDSIDDEMIQCIICEDWLHSRHLHGKGIPEGSDYAEMICHLCMENKTQFLWFYNWEYTPYESAVVDVLESPNKGSDTEIKSENADSVNLQKNEEELHEGSLEIKALGEFPTLKSTSLESAANGDGEIITALDSSHPEDKQVNYGKTVKLENFSANESSPDTQIKAANMKNETQTSAEINPSTVKKSVSNDDVEKTVKKEIVEPISSTNTEAKKVSIIKSEVPCTSTTIKKEIGKLSCKLEHLKQVYNSCEFPDSAAFWPDDWRTKLCDCENCKILMNEFAYLTNKDDTVAEYERKGAEKQPDSTMDKGMRALGGMNRIQQVEVIQGYNDMKSKLSDYLRTFAQEGKVVTEEDIRNFFKNMSESKKPRVDIPHLCK